MNTPIHPAPQNPVQKNGLEAELRARCPAWMKNSMAAIADARILDEADILREAVSEYLDRRKPKRRSEAKAVAT